MTSREFCYWLQGFFELEGNQPRPAEYATTLNSEQVKMIRNHLEMVFKHEIDPSYPNATELNNLHNSGLGSTAGITPGPFGTAGGDVKLRC